MQIIQEQSRNKNLDLVQEMNGFLNDDSGELGNAIWNEKFLFISVVLC